MAMWLAKDYDGSVWLYSQKPKRLDECFKGKDQVYIGDNVIPELTWENSPKEMIFKEK